MNSWTDQVRTVTPYVPGERPKDTTVIKLNTNENPYPPAPGVQKALELAQADPLRLYPDPTNGALVEALADFYGLNPEQIFVGVGSDDVLSMAFLTFFNGDKPILFPDITYSFYDVWADLYRIPYLLRPLDEDFRLRAVDYYTPNGGIIFPNPNAPTGLAEPLSFIEDILQHNPNVPVIIDEAYVDFSRVPSAVSLLDKYDNLLVVQTFSKSRSMAGMRIGFAMGSKAMIKALNDVKYSFNSYTMSRIALTLGTEAVKDRAYFDETRTKIMATREMTKEYLTALGFTFPDSDSNFIFAAHRTVDGGYLFEELKKRKIYVRHFNGERVKNYLRITVGTEEQMKTLVNALTEILKEANT